jgi:hypothetical protein
MGYVSTNVNEWAGGRNNTSLFAHRWELDKIECEDGPIMSFEGTVAKSLILLVLFSAGFLISWYHFHILIAHLSPVDKIKAIYHDMPAWEGSWPYVEFHYPLYAWLLFFLFFGGTFLTKCALVIVAPLSAAVLGVSCGSFECVLQNHYPYVSLISGLLVIGIFLGLIAIYWLGFAGTDNENTGNVIALFAAGAGGGLVFSYVATVVIRSFGVEVPFLHQMPANCNVFMLAGVVLGCGTVMNTFYEIQKAVEAGVPKWVEWRAAVCLFASFVILFKLVRRLLLHRSTGGLIWDVMKEAIPKSLR